MPADKTKPTSEPVLTDHDLAQILRASRDKLKAVFDTMADPMVSLTPEMAVQSINQSMATILGKHPRDLVGRKINDLLDPVWNEPRVLEPIKDAVMMAAGRLNRQQVLVKREGGGRDPALGGDRLPGAGRQRQALPAGGPLPRRHRVQAHGGHHPELQPGPGKHGGRAHPRPGGRPGPAAGRQGPVGGGLSAAAPIGAAPPRPHRHGGARPQGAPGRGARQPGPHPLRPLERDPAGIPQPGRDGGRGPLAHDHEPSGDRPHGRGAAGAALLGGVLWAPGRGGLRQVPHHHRPQGPDLPGG